MKTHLYLLPFFTSWIGPRPTAYHGENVGIRKRVGLQIPYTDSIHRLHTQIIPYTDSIHNVACENTDERPGSEG